jgi:hypothetical protein
MEIKAEIIDIEKERQMLAQQNQQVPETQGGTPEDPAATEAPESPETLEKPDAPGVPETPEDEYDDTKVKSFFEKKFGKTVESFEDLFKEPGVIEKEIELPEHVAAYNKYFKETGRSPEDWVKLNRDFDKMDPDQVLIEYYSHENPEWSRQEVLAEIKDRFGYDPDEIEEAEAGRIERLKKSEVAKAVKSMNSLKEQYAAPLASRELSLSDEEKADYESYKQWQQSDSQSAEKQQEVSKHFEEKTKALFSHDFKGFEFKVGENSLVYKPDSPEKLAKEQSSLINFVQSFLDKDGKLEDAAKFHRAIAIARDPDGFAKHFYEQGQADKVVDIEKESKNIDMTVRTASQAATQAKGVKMEVISDSMPGRLVIKSKNKNT